MFISNFNFKNLANFRDLPGKLFEFYKTHFGFELDSREVIESSGTELAFLKLENTKIKIITTKKGKIIITQDILVQNLNRKL